MHSDLLYTGVGVEDVCPSQALRRSARRRPLNNKRFRLRRRRGKLSTDPLAPAASPFAQKIAYELFISRKSRLAQNC